jgi:hypothetical protein
MDQSAEGLIDHIQRYRVYVVVIIEYIEMIREMSLIKGTNQRRD